MLRLLALLLLLIPAGCKSTPLTPEEQYARDLRQQQKEEEREAWKAKRDAKYQQDLRNWSSANDSGREAWSEATGGTASFGTATPYPRKPDAWR